MSYEYKYQPINFAVRTHITEDEEKIRTISIFVGDEEVVWGADTLEDAIQHFDWKL